MEIFACQRRERIEMVVKHVTHSTIRTNLMWFTTKWPIKWPTQSSGPPHQPQVVPVPPSESSMYVTAFDFIKLLPLLPKSLRTAGKGHVEGIVKRLT
jgi:hypothetical protein